MPQRDGVPGSATQRRQSPTGGRRSSSHPTCGRQASSPFGWCRGWPVDSWTSSCTAFTASTSRSSLPAWQPARGTSRATGTPSSRTSRVCGPATPTLGTTSSAPCQGHNPPPATAPAKDSAGLAVAQGLYPRLGPVGLGAGLDAGAGGSLLG